MMRCLLTWVCLLSFGSHALARVAPDNVVVVVNEDVNDSRKIAEAYVAARGIPANHLIELRGIPSDLRIKLDDFQSKILMPVLKEIDARGLAGKVLVIAYSAGFPTSVDVSRHHGLLEDELLKKYQKPTASITGLTYLYQFLLADSPHYFSFGANLYARGGFQRHFINPFMQEPSKSAFDKAAQSWEDKDYEAAGDGFETLFAENPSLASLAIRGAESRALQDDDQAASLLIRQAVAAGWRSARYLKQSDSLAELVEREELKPLVERLSDHPIAVQEPMPFSAQVGWANNGHPYARPDQGVRYMMSCMLAVVHERGSKADQAIEVLQRSAQADHTYPRGKFWFTTSQDIRTKTRFPAVGDAIQWLRHLGHDADLVHAVMPNQDGQCVGLMLGTPTTTLNETPWTFAPGAISENLTSLSAAFGTPSQSKITDLLHAGAALSGGAVAEPFSIPAKFPSPMLYGYYASGMSGIESFYLSITSPYQYLIVGDPLVQPFARPAP